MGACTVKDESRWPLTTKGPLAFTLPNASPNNAYTGHVYSTENSFSPLTS